MDTHYTPICMTQEYWANSMFSIARYYGGIKLDGHLYYIVNKEGKDLFELQSKAPKGDTYLIPPWEPADLVRSDFVKFYRKLGRDKFLEVLKANQKAEDTELIKIYKELIQKNDEQREND